MTLKQAPVLEILLVLVRKLEGGCLTPSCRYWLIAKFSKTAPASGVSTWFSIKVLLYENAMLNLAVALLALLVSSGDQEVKEMFVLKQKFETKKTFKHTQHEQLSLAVCRLHSEIVRARSSEHHNHGFAMDPSLVGFNSWIWRSLSDHGWGPLCPHSFPGLWGSAF
jgi:hypothetical protein